MDKAIGHELDELHREFIAALNGVSMAGDDQDRQLAAWHQVQVCGWRLNQLLPSAVGGAA